MPASTSAAAGTDHSYRGKLFSARNSARSCKQSHSTVWTRKEAKDKRHGKSSGMTERLLDQIKQMEKRFLVSQLDQSNFSHMPNLVGNQQEKQERESLLLARTSTFHPSPRRFWPSLPPDTFKRHPEIPACKSFCSGIPNTFWSLEMTRDGRIS